MGSRVAAPEHAGAGIGRASMRIERQSPRQAWVGVAFWPGPRLVSAVCLGWLGAARIGIGGR